MMAMIKPMTAFRGEAPGVLFAKAPFSARYVRFLESLPHPPGHRPFNMATGLWALEDLTSVRQSLRAAGFKVEPHKGEGPVAAPVRPAEPPLLPAVTGHHLHLYPFQEDGVRWLIQRRGRALLADEMGLGKTIQVLAFLKMKPMIRPALIVCPASLKLNWQAEAERWELGDHVRVLSGSPPRTGLLFSEAERKEGIFIINYDILGRWLDVFQHTKPKAVVFDECFTAGTPISTPGGQIPIERLHRGDTVLNASGTGTVLEVGRRITHNLIRLHLSNGKVITCTPDHPFLTESGWKAASELAGSRVFGPDTILGIVNSATSPRTEQDHASRKAVRTVSEETPPEPETRTLLREILLSEMEEYTPERESGASVPTKTGSVLSSTETRPCTQSGLGSPTVQANEHAQSHKPTGSDSEDQSNLERERASFGQTATSRRKRQSTAQSATCSMGSPGNAVEAGIQCIHGTLETSRNSDVLQSRSGAPRTENLDRSGRMESFPARTQDTRREEGLSAETIRVERVEVLEPAGGRGLEEHTVYNLQVSGHPSYYVAGVLVHNCHYCKSPQAKRSKASISIARRSLCVLCLSGTPITSRPVEMYTAIRMVDPNIFPSRWEYLHRYCAPRHNGFGWDFSGASNTKELHQKLTSTIMLRRLKKDVLKDLPPARRAMVPIPLSNMPEYNRILLETDRALNPSLGTTSAIAKIEALKQCAVRGKMEAVLEWAENFLASGQKLVLFAVHISTLDTLMERLRAWDPVRVSGSVSLKKRKEAVQRFQTDARCRLFVGNIQAAGVGSTLTAASNVAFLELPWTPGELVQAEARIHRIGQESERITSWLLLADHTIDMDIAKLLDRKAEILANVLDGKDTDPGTLLTELMEAVHRSAAAIAPKKARKTTNRQ